MPRRQSGGNRHTRTEVLERRILFSTYVVNTTSDATSAGIGLLTLRQAISHANTHAGSNTVAFDPNVLTAKSQHTITLTEGEIQSTDTSGTTTVSGPGSDVLSISGNEENRVFQVSSGVAGTLSGLSITNGMENTFAGVTAARGGVLNAGVLTVSRVTVCKSAANGGSVATNGGGNGGAAEGAGIYSTDSGYSLSNPLDAEFTLALGKGSIRGGNVFSEKKIA